jgi:hypothetical protein
MNARRPHAREQRAFEAMPKTIVTDLTSHDSYDNIRKMNAAGDQLKCIRSSDHFAKSRFFAQQQRETAKKQRAGSLLFRLAIFRKPRISAENERSLAVNFMEKQREQRKTADPRLH